jgi:hypothetical protein
MALQPHDCLRKYVENLFLNALLAEYTIAHTYHTTETKKNESNQTEIHFEQNIKQINNSPEFSHTDDSPSTSPQICHHVLSLTHHKPKCVVIVDDNVQSQPLYSEMQYFCHLLIQNDIPAFACSPEELILAEDGTLKYISRDHPSPHEYIVDFLYNRMTDFRFQMESHLHIRQSIERQKVIVSPHPAAYVRIADKRQLLHLKHTVVPNTVRLGDVSFNDWMKIRKDFVFKPPDGSGSKGVYLGHKISVKKLKELDPNSIAQEFCTPPISSLDQIQTKYDFRVVTHDDQILGVMSRHFTGQVMEMRSEHSGFRISLPVGVCWYEINSI